MRILSGRTLVGALALALVGIAPVTASHGQPADSTTVQRAAIPGAPRDVRVEVTPVAVVYLRWQPPADSAVVTGYRLSWDGRSRDIPADRRIEGIMLTPDRAYDISIAALSDEGAGDEVRVTGRTFSRTLFDFDTEIDQSAGTLTLRWSRVSHDPRSPVTGWRVQRYRDVFDLPADARSYTFTGLTPGQRSDFSVSPLYDGVTGSITDYWGQFVTFGQPSSAPLDLALGPVRNGSALLTWQAPQSPGDTDFIAYEWSLDGGRWQDGGKGSAEVPGLVPGETYDVAVRARTAAGYSRPATARLVATTPPEPSAPTDVKARAGNRKVLVRWTAPTSSSPITEYRITIRPQLREWVVPGNRTSALLRRLQNGREVVVRVRAINEAGESVKSEPSNTVVPATTPGRVWRMRVRQTGKKLIFKWLRPNKNGAPIERYRVRFNGTTKTVSTRRMVVRKPARRSYQIRVKAINGVGAGQFSRPFGVQVKGR